MFANNSGMKDLEHANKAWLAERLADIAHGERGKVAAAAGVTPTQLSRMANVDPKAPPKNTQNIPLAKLRAFAEYFGDAPPGLAGTESAQLIRPEGPEESETRPAPDAPRFSEMGDFDVEVRGVTVGGEDDEFYFNGQVLEYVRRPPGLSRKKEVFAVNVSNDSMYPRYDPGDLVYAQKANPVAGDDVLIELYHPDDENLAGKSFVKTFVRRTGRRITCKQFNPPKEVEFDAGEVRQICKVFRNRDLFG